MKRLIRLAAVAALSIGWSAAAVPAQAGDAASNSASSNSSAANSCQLGNGVQHVINIVFDNTHFSRDNPMYSATTYTFPADEIRPFRDIASGLRYWFPSNP